MTYLKTNKIPPIYLKYINLFRDCTFVTKIIIQPCNLRVRMRLLNANPSLYLFHVFISYLQSIACLIKYPC